MSPAVKPDAQALSDRGWEQFPHDADVGLRGWGPSIEVAFEQAALALTGIVTDAEIAATTRVEVACEAPDVELLLVEWLNAIIYEMAVRSMLFGRFEVRITGTRLQRRHVGRANRPSEAFACLRAERCDLYGAPRCARALTDFGRQAV